MQLITTSLLIAVLAVAAHAGRGSEAEDQLLGSGDGARYIMLIPGRAGSTRAAELLVEHGVRADREIFSGMAHNRLGNGVLCQLDEGLNEACIAALEQYWAENDTAWRNEHIKTALMNLRLRGVITRFGRIQLEHRLKTAPILARGFKVRPTPGWQTDRMFQYLAKRQVKLICNVRQNLIAVAVSMYRQPLSDCSRFWNSIVERFGKPEFNNTRQRIPPEVLEEPHSFPKRLNATCIVQLGDDRYQAAQQFFSLHSCTQNISTEAFRQFYHQAAAMSTRVYQACARYRFHYDGATHWLEYENLLKHPEATTNGILEYLGVPVTPKGERYRMASRQKITDRRGGITGMQHSVPNIAEVLDPLMAATSCEGAVSAALPTLKPAVLPWQSTYLSPHAMESLMLCGTEHVRPRGPTGFGLTAPFIVVIAPEAGLNPDGFRQHPRVAQFADGINLDLLPLESANGPCAATCGTRCRNTIRDEVVAKLTHHDLPEHRQSAGFAVSRDHHIWHDTSVMEFLKSHEFRMVCLTRTALIGAALVAFHRDAAQQPRNVSLDALVAKLLDLHAANNAVIKACWGYERLCPGCTLWLPYHKRDNATARINEFLGIGDGAAAANGVSMTPPPLVSSDEGRSPPDFATYQARVPNLPELVMQYLETAVDLTENSNGIVRPYFDAHSVQEILTS